MQEKVQTREDQKRSQVEYTRIVDLSCQMLELMSNILLRLLLIQQVNLVHEICSTFLKLFHLFSDFTASFPDTSTDKFITGCKCMFWGKAIFYVYIDLMLKGEKRIVLKALDLGTSGMLANTFPNFIYSFFFFFLVVQRRFLRSYLQLMHIEGPEK